MCLFYWYNERSILWCTTTGESNDSDNDESEEEKPEIDSSESASEGEISDNSDDNESDDEGIKDDDEQSVTSTQFERQRWVYLSVLLSIFCIHWSSRLNTAII